MKKFISIATIAIIFSFTNSCNHFTPAKDNNFVMMRANDIPLKQDVINRQKHIDKPSHVLNLKRFFRELFSPNKSKNLPRSPKKIRAYK